jgi:hypothetical protein
MSKLFNHQGAACLERIGKLHLDRRKPLPQTVALVW